MVERSEYRRVLGAVRRGVLDGSSLDEVVEEFRRNGFHQVESIRALIELDLCEPHEAKRTVHFSTAWSSTREANEDLHSRLEAALIESLKENE
ncbi:hypothetical protein [Embleya sp. NBC_00896]|uniref:hypothetical protein n=1 Tax=Embleya sp. NBC_00896 TaxID=2975961 RepID=UPI002F913885|nr:hypothetical protein OG928_33310 [Embleya sp. NBC_00896]